MFLFPACQPCVRSCWVANYFLENLECEVFSRYVCHYLTVKNAPLCICLKPFCNMALWNWRIHSESAEIYLYLVHERIIIANDQWSMSQQNNFSQYWSKPSNDKHQVLNIESNKQSCWRIPTNTCGEFTILSNFINFKQRTKIPCVRTWWPQLARTTEPQSNRGDAQP